MAGRPNSILTAVCCLLLSSLVSSRSLTASYTFPDPTAELYRQTDADRAPHITHSSRSLATTYTVPDPPAELYRQIDADLAPYKARGINKSMVDGVFCGIRDPGFRVQIKNQEVYIVGEVKGFQSRNRNLKLALIDMASHHKDLPDADFVMGTYDWTATEVQSVAGMEDGGPVFAQVGSLHFCKPLLWASHRLAAVFACLSSSQRICYLLSRLLCRYGLTHVWQTICRCLSSYCCFSSSFPHISRLNSAVHALRTALP